MRDVAVQPPRLIARVLSNGAFPPGRIYYHVTCLLVYLPCLASTSSRGRDWLRHVAWEETRLNGALRFTTIVNTSNSPFPASSSFQLTVLNSFSRSTWSRNTKYLPLDHRLLYFNHLLHPITAAYSIAHLHTDHQCRQLAH